MLSFLTGLDASDNSIGMCDCCWAACPSTSGRQRFYAGLGAERARKIYRRGHGFNYVWSRQKWKSL